MGAPTHAIRQPFAGGEIELTTHGLRPHDATPHCDRTVINGAGASAN